jgi:acetyl esterase/lipase
MLTALLAACSPLSLYNGLAPRDSGSVRAGHDIAFGVGTRQRLDVYRPKGAVKPPLVIFVYGGSWADGKRQNYAFIASVFAARGYVTIVPDYRLVPEVRFPAFVEDGAAAVAWAVKHAKDYGADPSQIFLIGHSAGAYNVAMLGLDAQYLRAAGVDAKAVRGVIGLAGPYDFYPFDVAASVNAFGQTPDPKTTQPITYVRNNAPPMLLLHGSEDTTVKPRNTLSLTRKLEDVGAPVQSHVYTGLSHAGILLALTPPFRKRSNVLADVDAFMAAQAVK